jgi:hypothetical protein
MSGMSVLVQLHCRSHCWIQLLPDRNRAGCRTGVEEMPARRTRNPCEDILETLPCQPRQLDQLSWRPEPVCGLDKGRVRVFAVRAIALGAKAVTGAASGSRNSR